MYGPYAYVGEETSLETLTLYFMLYGFLVQNRAFLYNIKKCF